MVKLCCWFGVARGGVYYRSTKAPPNVKLELAEPIRELIEAEPSFGYRTVAGLLGVNKNTVQRILQLKDWASSQAAVGHRPRIEALPSVATAPEPTLGHEPVPGLGRQGRLLRSTSSSPRIARSRAEWWNA